MSLLWIWFTANLLVSLLTTIATILNIPDSFLGMTILCYGNSIGDLMLNISLVKMGYGEMALSGSISGPLFNLLVGLGLSLVQLNLSGETVKISFFEFKNLIPLICLFFLLLNIITLGIHAKYQDYHLNVKLSIVRFTLYFAFLGIITYLAFKK